MKALKLGIIGLILAGALAAPFLARQRAAIRWRARQAASREQSAVLDQLSAENQRLSNLVAQAKSPLSLSPAQSSDLLKLRNEVGQLRRTLKEMEQLELGIKRLQARLEETSKEEEGRDNYTALLADELPRRQARVARLKRWLEETPEEKIPELQSLPETAWIRRVDDPLVTDQDYLSAMSLLRADADATFGRMAFSALKQYGQANNGQFPTDLSQLEPFFASPMDPAILQRYEIVPAKSLVSSLAAIGGDWVITEKAPVNKELDQRLAISMTGGRQVIQKGRWDPVP